MTSAAINDRIAAAGGGASVLGDLTDVTMDITNFVDGILIQPNSDGSAPTTGTLNSATENIGIGKDVLSALTSADYSTFVGSRAGEAINSGSYNTGFGRMTLYQVTTQTNNTAVGYFAGGGIQNGGNNTAIGTSVLGANNSAAQNTGVGSNALANTTANNNTAVGYRALYGNTSGQRNIAIGVQALDSASTETDNIAIGHETMYNPNGGDKNVTVGNYSLDAITSGNNNVAYGHQAASAVNSGSNNITIGYQAGDNITTGSGNVVIGAADVSSATGDDQLSISSGDGDVTWLTGTSAGAVVIPVSLTLGGHMVNDIDVAGEFVDSDNHLMTSAAINDRISAVGGGIADLVDDTSPQLGGDLDTNGHDIIIDDGKGIYADAISNGRELLLFQHTSNATAYLQVWNGISDAATGTLFGNDVVHTDTTNIGRITGPGIEATGSATDVGMSFRAKGLGQFSFFADDTSASGAPVVNMIRYVDDGDVADDDILGQIKWMGGQSSMVSPFLHDLRTYARIEANLVDVTTGSTDGNLMFSAMVANSHTDYLEVGTNKTNDTSAGVRAYTGSMVTVSGTGTTALSRDTHAGAYVRATGAGTFTLWDNPNIGDQVVVISDHGGTTTIDGYSNDTINGAANTTITTQYNAKTFIATSTTTWIALG